MGLDLHVHTTSSDGTLSPADAVAEAAERDVTLIAITDHDTTEGFAEAEAAGRTAGVTVIPGIELSADSASHDIHVLGYFLDPDREELQAALRELRESRDARNERIIEKLAELGARVPAARVQEIAGSGSVGRPHIAAAMVEAGHVSSRGEAFHRYLARNKPAFVARKQLTAARAAEIVHAAGGLAVLSHPAKIGSRSVVDGALDAGLDGIEVFHSDHTAHDSESLLALAKERGLLVVGGTDTHGPHSGRAIAIGSVTVPAWVGEELLARAPKWWQDRQRAARPD